MNIQPDSKKFHARLIWVPVTLVLLFDAVTAECYLLSAIEMPKPWKSVKWEIVFWLTKKLQKCRSYYFVYNASFTKE